jgi:hypothetical protein
MSNRLVCLLLVATTLSLEAADPGGTGSLPAAKPAAAKDQPLTGRVAGQEWTPIVCRRARAQFDESGKSIRVDASAEVIKSFAVGTKPKLMIKLPTAVGTYPLSATFSVTMFIPPHQNQVLHQGVIRVTTVSDTSIKFSIEASDDRGIEVAGGMTADITPLPDAFDEMDQP